METGKEKEIFVSTDIITMFAIGHRRNQKNQLSICHSLFLTGWNFYPK